MSLHCTMGYPHLKDATCNRPSTRQVTMANIEAGSKRLYAHAVLAWAVSLYALRLLWRANQDAVR